MNPSVQLYTPAKRNQAANANNPYQGGATKALCVCSAGLLRSPSIAKYLSSLNYNTRACGTNQEYALVPLSEALVYWADEIHVVKEQELHVEMVLKELGVKKPLRVYDIPDEYRTFDTELMKLIDAQYQNQE